jgi:hypothetical protein
MQFMNSLEKNSVQKQRLVMILDSWNASYGKKSGCFFSSTMHAPVARSLALPDPTGLNKELVRKLHQM